MTDTIPDHDIQNARAGDWWDVQVVIYLRDRSLTFNGISGAGLCEVRALETAWRAGEHGPTHINVATPGGGHRVDFDYTDIVRIEVTER